MAGVRETNLVAKAVAVENGLRKDTVMAVSHDMVNAPTISTDAALPPLAKVINGTNSACNQFRDDCMIPTIPPWKSLSQP